MKSFMEKGQVEDFITMLFDGFPITEYVTLPGQNMFITAALIGDLSILQALREISDEPSNQNPLPLEAKDTSGRNALHMACLSGCPEKVQYLLDLGFDKDSKSNGDQSPLMFAVMSSNIDTVATCLQAGMNPFAQNSLGQTAKDIAKSYPKKQNFQGQLIKIGDLLDKVIQQQVDQLQSNREATRED